MVTRSFRCLVFAGLLFLSTGGACGEAEAGEGGSLFSERRQRHEDLVARDPTLGAAMEKALAWLAAHQSPNGSWSGADAVRQCNGEPLEQALDGAGEDQWTVGLTGLALLGFLGTGRELGGSWAYEDTVRRGIAFLLRQQSDEGYFGPHLEFQGTYNHAVATLAMLEAVGMGAGPAARASAERAVAYILHTRTPGAGWRYTPVALQTDVSVTTWMFLCLHTATQLQENETRSNGVLGVEMSPTVRAEVRAFVESLTDPTFGRVGYIVRGSGPARHRERIDTFPAHRSESMTAAGLLTRALAGETR